MRSFESGSSQDGIVAQRRSSRRARTQTPGCSCPRPNSRRAARPIRCAPHTRRAPGRRAAAPASCRPSLSRKCQRNQAWSAAVLAETQQKPNIDRGSKNAQVVAVGNDRNKWRCVRNTGSGARSPFGLNDDAEFERAPSNSRTERTPALGGGFQHVARIGGDVQTGNPWGGKVGRRSGRSTLCSNGSTRLLSRIPSTHNTMITEVLLLQW